GYRSQLFVTLVLTDNRSGYCFEDLVKVTKIHRTRMKPNLDVLLSKGWIVSKREGHKKIYQVKSEDVLFDYFCNLGFKQFKDDGHQTPIASQTFLQLGNQTAYRLNEQPILE